MENQVSNIIHVNNVSKSFSLPTENINSIKGLFMNFFRKNRYKKLNVLSNVDFEVKKGEFFGVVGKNGSGKSTLLKLLAGIYSQDSGDIKISGRLTPFIELGVGFNPELTGRENVYLNGALLGFSRKEINRMYDEIVDFSELSKFMDQKLKNYSSGMQVRLAFSIAIKAESEILLIDEVLAVGDAIFQKKCFNYFKELKKRNRTVIFISHDTSSLIEFCDSGILINKGKIVSRGKITDVVNDYIDILNNESDIQNKKLNDKIQEHKRWGVGGINVVSASTERSDDNTKQTIFTDDDKFIKIKVNYKSDEQLESPVYGLTITDASGVNIFTSNTLWQKKTTKSTTQDKTIKVEWKIPNIFTSGKYYISPAVANKYGSTIYDWRENFLFFEVSKKTQTTAIINVDNSVVIKD